MAIASAKGSHGQRLVDIRVAGVRRPRGARASTTSLAGWRWLRRNGASGYLPCLRGQRRRRRGHVATGCRPVVRGVVRRCDGSTGLSRSPHRRPTGGASLVPSLGSCCSASWACLVRHSVFSRGGNRSAPPRCKCLGLSHSLYFLVAIRTSRAHPAGHRATRGAITRCSQHLPSARLTWYPLGI